MLSCKLTAVHLDRRKMDAHRRSLRVPSPRRSTCLGLECLGGRLEDAHQYATGTEQGRENALIPVKTMICPDFLSRIAGSAALMMLTGPK